MAILTKEEGRLQFEEIKYENWKKNLERLAFCYIEQTQKAPRWKKLFSSRNKKKSQTPSSYEKHSF